MSQEERTIARIRKDSEKFEIIVNCAEAMKVREGNGSIEDALLAPEIYKDANKGEKHGELEKYFGTEDVMKIAEEIITKGEIKLTQSYKNELVEQKKKQIINKISRQAIDPQTKNPIPPKRVELGLEKAGIKIDYYKSVKEQIKDVIDRLKKVMPISLQELIIKAIVSPIHTGKLYGLINKYAQVTNQNYLPNGNAEFTIKVPGGLKNKLVRELQSATHGNIIIKEE